MYPRSATWPSVGRVSDSAAGLTARLPCGSLDGDMGSLIERNKVIAKRKGTVAAAATTGSLAVMVLINPILGVLGLAGSAFLGYDWFKFRAKNGMRF